MAGHMAKKARIELRSTTGQSRHKNDVIVVEPPEVRGLREWLAIDGVKGHWGHNLRSAEIWGLEIDDRHNNIAFYLEQIFAMDPPTEVLEAFLFQVHQLKPSDRIDLARLEQLLAEDAAEMPPKWRHQFQQELKVAAIQQTMMKAPSLRNFREHLLNKKKKLEGMREVCEAKTRLSWSELTTKYEVSERTVRRWAIDIGYDLEAHQYLKPQAAVSAQRKSRKPKSKKSAPKSP